VTIIKLPFAYRQALLQACHEPEQFLEATPRFTPPAFCSVRCCRAPAIA
jgi:hypothetical protein